MMGTYVMEHNNSYIHYVIKSLAASGNSQMILLEYIG